MSLEIPYLGQNVAQPEIPENEAKDIISAAVSEILNITMSVDSDYLLKETNSDATSTYPHEWQHCIIVLNNVAHTQIVDLIIPELKVRSYIIHNKTDANIIVTQYGAEYVTVPTNSIYSIYCDGINVWRVT